MTFNYSNDPSLVSQLGGKGLVILKPKRGKLVRHAEAIEPQAVSAFIDDVLGGGGTWQKLDADLQFSDQK